MKALTTTSLIIGIILAIMGIVNIVTAIVTSAGLEAIVVGALFTLSGIASILNSRINAKSKKEE